LSLEVKYYEFMGTWNDMSCWSTCWTFSGSELVFKLINAFGARSCAQLIPCVRMCVFAVRRWVRSLELQHLASKLDGRAELSVRKVVPTLTSTSAEIYLLMAGAKQLGDTRFILVPAGAVRPAGVCPRHCIGLHCGACRGALQARRERRRNLLVHEVWLRLSANIVVKTESV
jgi:hypothetical protein